MTSPRSLNLSILRAKATAGDVIALRVRLGLTQKELAVRLNVSEYTVWRWENGARNVSKKHTTLLRSMSPGR
jgi:DNA-binding transcriptional regulator YiaG